ncbi:hypothetical protein ABK040_010069 [Willaertia magna]
MKNKRIRPFHYFLKFFAEPVIDNSKEQVVTGSGDNNNDELVLFKDQSQEQIQDGSGGYNIIFLNILSFLDEYDLAQSIEPVCKLFHSFASCDYLWKNLYESNVKQLCEGKNDKEIENVNKYKLYNDEFEPIVKDRFISEYKTKLINFTRKYYSMHPYTKIYSDFDYEFYYYRCAACDDKFERDDTIFRNNENHDTYHFDCLDKQEIKKDIDHLYQIPNNWGLSRSELVNLFFGNRLIKQKESKINFEDSDEDSDEEQEANYVCDHCGDGILQIRYHCLDCGYDLCGICCEHYLMQQKMNNLKEEEKNNKYLSLITMNKEEPINHDDSHTLVEVDGENFDTYTCDLCKDKIRGIRYRDTLEDDYDLCEWCFLKNYEQFVNEKKSDSSRFEKFNLSQTELTNSLYEQLLKKLNVKEIRTILENMDDVEIEKGVAKKDLIEHFLFTLLEHREEGKKLPSLLDIIFKSSDVPRLCAKDCKDNVLSENDFDVLISSFDKIEDKEQPPLKKVKQK